MMPEKSDGPPPRVSRDALLVRLAGMGFGSTTERVELVRRDPRAVAAALAALDAAIAAGRPIANRAAYLRRIIDNGVPAATDDLPRLVLPKPEPDQWSYADRAQRVAEIREAIRRGKEAQADPAGGAK